MQNPFQICIKSFWNRLRLSLESFWAVFGAVSRPSRLQDGSPQPPVYHSGTFFVGKWCSKAAVCDHPLFWNGSKIKLLSIVRRLDSPKMASRWKFRQTHYNFMKNRCELRSYLMAQNHVWRYTLRLFHTFAIFEKSRKIDAKMDA